MKKLSLYYISLLTLLVTIITSCTKDALNSNQPGAASIIIINARPDIQKALLNFTNGPIIYSADKGAVSYGSSIEYGKPAGALPLTIVSSADTLTALYKGPLTMNNGGLYSFYMFGQATDAQTMLLQDQIPAHQDSVSGVRFINLSPDSQPLSINLQGNPPTKTEFSNLSYKQITAFKSYSANNAAISAGGGYNFEVRNAAGSLITTFFWSFTLFKNNTLVISGYNSSASVNVFQVNNF